MKWMYKESEKKREKESEKERETEKEWAEPVHSSQRGVATLIK